MGAEDRLDGGKSPGTNSTNTPGNALREPSDQGTTMGRPSRFVIVVTLSVPLRTHRQQCYFKSVTSSCLGRPVLLGTVRAVWRRYCPAGKLPLALFLCKE